jgi:hypothetical protein
MTATETDFDELPELLRLALIEDARERLADRVTGQLPAVTPGRLAEAAGADPVAFHRHCRIALLKLRAQAHDLDLDLSDFINP